MLQSFMEFLVGLVLMKKHEMGRIYPQPSNFNKFMMSSVQSPKKTSLTAIVFICKGENFETVTQFKFIFTTSVKLCPYEQRLFQFYNHRKLQESLEQLLGSHDFSHSLIFSCF